MTIPQSELATLMQQSAEDAKKFSEAEFGIHLDGSESSLAIVDELITRCAEKVGAEKENEKLIFTLCNIFGAYVGEVFRNRHGGEWVYDDSNPEAPAVFLKLSELTFTFMGMAYQRLTLEPNVSLALYYEKAAEKVEQVQH